MAVEKSTLLIVQKLASTSADISRWGSILQYVELVQVVVRFAGAIRPENKRGE